MSRENNVQSTRAERKTLILALVAGMCSDALLSWLTMSSVPFSSFSTLSSDALSRVFGSSGGGRGAISRSRLFLRRGFWSLGFYQSTIPARRVELFLHRHSTAPDLLDWA